MPDFPITDYGAVGDATTDDGPAIQQAIDACHAHGGGRVVLPGGATYLSGGLRLKSRVDLHIERGARLRAHTDRELLLPIGEVVSNFNGPDGKPRLDRIACFLHADGAERIAITGGGVIDGNGRAWIERSDRHFHYPKPNRPRLIILERVNHLTIRDIEIHDAPNWTLHPAGCEDVLIHGIRITNDWQMPNCDGIDLDHCRDVRISDCMIVAGDDGIVLKNHRMYADYGPCERITITGCTIVSTSCAIKIGTESFADFRDIVVTGCVIRDSNRGLGIQIRDHGRVERVLFSDCIIQTRHFSEHWWGKAEPIHVSIAPRRPNDPVSAVEDVVFRNILCQSEAGVQVHATAPARIRGLRFDACQLTIVSGSSHPTGFRDLRPQGGDEHGGLEQRHTNGFTIVGAEDVSLTDCRVRWSDSAPEHCRHVLESHRVRELDVFRLHGTGYGDHPACLHDGEALP